MTTLTFSCPTWYTHYITAPCWAVLLLINVFAIISSLSYQTSSLKTVVAFARDDNMVQNTESEYLPGVRQLIMHTKVGFAGVAVAGRMVVRKDHSGRAIGNNISEDLARVNRALIEKADSDDAFLNNLICTIQGYTDKILLLFSGNICNKGKDVLSNGDLDGFLQQVASGEFEGRKNLRCLGEPHAGHLKKVVEAQSLLMFPNESSNLSGNRADIHAGRTHAENRRDKFFVSEGRCTLLPQLLSWAAMFR